MDDRNDEIERAPELQSLIADLQRAQGADGLVLLAWWKRLRKMARSHLPANSPLRCGLDSEDLLQDGLLKLVKHVGCFRGATWPEFLAFVNSVLQQRVVDHARRLDVRRKEHMVQDLQPVARDRTPSVNVAEREERQRLTELIEDLPEPYRAAMLMRLSGLANSEIATRLGVAEVALRKRLSRAMKMLKERW